jgi:hypothetical protein
MGAPTHDSDQCEHILRGRHEHGCQQQSRCESVILQRFSPAPLKLPPNDRYSAITCLLVALHSGITLQHEQSKRTKAVSSPFQRAAQSKVAWEDCNKQEYRRCLAAYPMQHAQNDSEGKSQTLCIHLKAVPLLICALPKVNRYKVLVGGGGYHCGNSRFSVWSRSTVGGLPLWIGTGRMKSRLGTR